MRMPDFPRRGVRAFVRAIGFPTPHTDLICLLPLLRPQIHDMGQVVEG